MSQIMTRSLRALLLILAPCALLFTTSLAFAGPSRVFRVAGLFDLTGGGAIWGISERNAFAMACEDFERAHPNIKVLPLIEDTMLSNRQTVTALHKIAAIDKIHYVVGATWETTVAMMPICEAKKIICISPSYHGKEYYTRPWRYNFTAWFDDRDYADTIVAQLNERGYERIAIFAAITPYYDSLVEHLTPRSKGRITRAERMTLEERDFRAMIARIPRDVQAIVMLLDNAGQIQAFMKQWSETRRDRPDIYSDDLISYLDPPENISRYGFDIFYSYPIFESSQLLRFNERYRARYNEPPTGSSAIVTYDETMLLLSCMHRAPEVEGVRECLVNTHEYDGLSGRFSFDGRQTASGRAIGIKRYTHQNIADGDDHV
jgi:ABC-type branched-subunit amino acid transport system substrate-binding protein